MPSICTFIAAFVASSPLVHAIQLDLDNVTSINAASRRLAHGVMSWYHNNQTDTPYVDVGTFPAPLYWWNAGAIWGGMIDNWAYTGDDTYVSTITQGMLAQIGPDKNFMPPAYKTSLGNDDQAFWALSSLSAAEYDFPMPVTNASTMWLDLAEAVFNTMWPRWDTTSCGGGLKWQIYSSNAGYNYKNTISNGGFFQIAARLARHTGNQTYVEWADKAWNWMTAIGLIDSQYQVYDGTDSTINCSSIDHTYWSYNPAILLYGAVNMYTVTGYQSWSDRAMGLLNFIETTFFSPYPNSTNIMFEPSCEPEDTCNYDQLSFKAYLARWMSKSAVLLPEMRPTVSTLLDASALAAARSCSGFADGGACGTKWYTGGFDGYSGPDQELCAMETIQSLLLLKSLESPSRAGESSTSATSTASTSSATSNSTTDSTTSSRETPSTSIQSSEISISKSAVATSTLHDPTGSPTATSTTPTQVYPLPADSSSSTTKSLGASRDVLIALLVVWAVLAPR